MNQSKQEEINRNYQILLDVSKNFPKLEISLVFDLISTFNNSYDIINFLNGGSDIINNSNNNLDIFSSITSTSNNSNNKYFNYFNQNTNKKTMTTTTTTTTTTSNNNQNKNNNKNNQYHKRIMDGYTTSNNYVSDFELDISEESEDTIRINEVLEWDNDLVCEWLSNNSVLRLLIPHFREINVTGETLLSIKELKQYEQYKLSTYGLKKNFEHEMNKLLKSNTQDHSSNSNNNIIEYSLSQIKDIIDSDQQLSSLKSYFEKNNINGIALFYMKKENQINDNDFNGSLSKLKHLFN